MTELDIAYAAGFFDGEGCISIAKNGAIEIRVVNTSRKVLEKLESCFGGSITDRTQKVNKQQYAYSFYGDEGIQFLETIKEYLIEKRPQAETIIEYMQLRNELKPITKAGQRGRFANPDRTLLVEVFREILTEQKAEEN